MESNHHLYEQRYKQLNLLGRGNYGQAYRVRSNLDGKFYVAKKMQLEGLSEQQVQAAWGEIQILKKFNDMGIPFIVEYKECFQFEKQLIIIMEYCECGDLSTYLKNCKKNKQILSEKIIAYWFIQLLFGVKALHSKNVLHRDLKSANVFVTSNYCLKIGDFGISKILDTTSAKTCIGTPLYLSPQVCNSQPYGLSSDLWALGCIIYELCTLRYPFEASNMIVLAKKIVCDEVKPIPNYYSKELNDIVMKLFIKESKKRITVEEILQTAYIKQYLFTFKDDQGKLKQLATPMDADHFGQVANTQNVKVSKIKEEERSPQQETMMTIRSVVVGEGSFSSSLNYTKTEEFNKMTPKQQMAWRKEEKVRKQKEVIIEAAKQKSKQQKIANTLKQLNLGQTSEDTQKFGATLKNAAKQVSQANKAKSEIKFKDKQMQKIQSIDLVEIMRTVKNPNFKYKQEQEESVQFEEVPLPGNSSYLPVYKTKKESETLGTNRIEENIEQYNDDADLEEYYDEEFEEYTPEISEVKKEKQQEKKQEYESVKAFYENQIGSSNVSPSKREKIQNIFKNEEIKPISSNKKIDFKRDESIKLVGIDKFNDLYKKVQGNKIDIKTITKNYSKDQIKVIHNIQEILYYENTGL